MEIIEKRQNQLLNRTEIVALENYDAVTPSRDVLRKKVAETLKSNEDLVVIKHIYPIFGKRSAKIIAHIYDNKKDCELIEPKNIFTKGKKEKKPKPTEK